jgi:hypothetical protein
MKNIVVFYGQKGTGKDTCYELLQKISHTEVTKISFADKLRDTCWSLFQNKLQDKERLYGSIAKKEEVIEGWEVPSNLGFKEKFWTGRRLLQWFGTEVCRNIYGNIWIDSLGETLEKKHEDTVCITDCRFKNEYDYLNSLNDSKKYRVIFVKIDRKTDDNVFGTHASEQDMSRFFQNYTIVNDGNVEDLRLKIKKFYHDHLL